MTIRNITRFNLLSIVAVSTVAALIATSCGGDDTVVEGPAPTTSAATTTQPAASDSTTTTQPETSEPAAGVQEPEVDAGTGGTVETDTPSTATTTVPETDTATTTVPETDNGEMPPPEDEDSQSAVDQEPAQTEAPPLDVPVDVPAADANDTQSEGTATPVTTVPGTADPQPEVEPVVVPVVVPVEPTITVPAPVTNPEHYSDEVVAVLERIDVIIGAALARWDDGDYDGACVLVAEARVIADNHAATSTETLGSAWTAAMAVLTQWETACVERAVPATAEPEDDPTTADELAVLERVNELLDEALDRWGSGDYCHLVDEARAVVDSAAAPSDPSDSVLTEALSALAQWEETCEHQSEPPHEHDGNPEWVKPYAGYVPPVHPDAPLTEWQDGSWNPKSASHDQPRMTPAVQAWVDWCPDGWSGCTFMQRRMVWALDYLGGNELCVLDQYYKQAQAAAESYGWNFSAPSLKERYGWHRCATVIDPEQPDGRLLSEQPGVTVADRCRAVLPADVELEYRFGSRIDEENLDCDGWAVFIDDRSTLADTCDRSWRLAHEWLEHYHDMPDGYGGITNC